jgi:hypothetical protein
LVSVGLSGVIVASSAATGAVSSAPTTAENPVEWTCCEEADITNRPELIGCNSLCSEGGVPITDLACSDEGNSSGPVVYPGGCMEATSETLCRDRTLTTEVPLFWCRRKACGGAMYECQWKPDGSKFPITTTDCEGDPCFG